MTSNLKLVEKAQQLLEPIESYTAKVISANDTSSEFIAQLNDGTLVTVRKALSCLLLPVVDDTVIISGDNSNGLFIVHILARGQAIASIVNLGDNVELSANNMTLNAATKMSIRSQEIEMLGQDADIQIKNIKLLSAWTELNIERVSLVVDIIEKIANTVNEKIKNIFRSIEGVESTKASNVRSIITGRLFCKANNVTMKADEEVAIDGKKINIG